MRVLELVFMYGNKYTKHRKINDVNGTANV